MLEVFGFRSHASEGAAERAGRWLPLHRHLGCCCDDHRSAVRAKRVSLLPTDTGTPEPHTLDLQPRTPSEPVRTSLGTAVSARCTLLCWTRHSWCGRAGVLKSGVHRSNEQRYWASDHRGVSATGQPALLVPVNTRGQFCTKYISWHPTNTRKEDPFAFASLSLFLKNGKERGAPSLVACKA